MSKSIPFSLTREKHLDHMTKVVPFIVMMFGIQGYLLTKINESLGTSAIFVLAGCLISMITAFITYDVRHQVTFFESHLEIKFLGLDKKIMYSEVLSVQISESNQTFASLQLKTKQGHHRFFFVDDADAIKAFLESQKNHKLKAAA
jgi:hypothetical protein